MIEDMNEQILELVAKGELARIYMAEISNHFIHNNNLTKNEFFKLGKNATNRMRNELNDAEA